MRPTDRSAATWIAFWQAVNGVRLVVDVAASYMPPCGECGLPFADHLAMVDLAPSHRYLVRASALHELKERSAGEKPEVGPE